MVPLKIRPKREARLPKYTTGGLSSTVPSSADSEEDFGVRALSDDDGSVKGHSKDKDDKLQ